MKNQTRRLKAAIGLAFLALTSSALTANAASVALASAPLANATTTSVLPNLMFVMDNSGSMGQEHTPDWVMEYNMRNAPWTYNGDWNSPETNEKNCRDSADDGAINTALDQMDMCVMGDVPFTTSAINSQYYNPEIRYIPGANADGTSKPSQEDPTNVLLDGYNKHNKTQLGDSGTTINLTTDYPDRVWCTTQTPTAAQISGATTTSTVCRINSDYLYPDATYKYGRDSNTTIANKDVLGKYGAPYYYTPVVTEYCSETELRNCVLSSTPTGSYTFAAKSRWCSDTALTNCQSIKTSTYIYPRYPGTSITAVAATGSITLNNTTNTNGRSVSSIILTVGSSPPVEILGATVSGSSTMSSTTLAANIKTQINTYISNPEFTATSAGNVITITSTTAAGASANGTLGYTHAGSAVNSKVNTSGGITGVNTPPYTFARTDIVAPVAPDVGSYPKAATRTDCVGDTCTYAEEITNFGNWYAYYRTRMQSMKSSVSNAFKPIGSNYRVGFMNICKGDYLPPAGFDNTTLAVDAVSATGSITLTSATGTTGKNVSSIKVGSVEILGATVSGSSDTPSTTLATNIAAQITSFVSTPDYTATASGNVITIKGALAAGAAANGTIATTKTTNTISSQTNLAGGVTGVGQKNYWYDKLFNTTASGCGTPLRSALATVGRIYAGKELSVAGSTSGSTIDPVQYSCQKNFTLLTTDGYWNSDTTTSIKDLLDSAMGNMDASPTARPMFEGPTASSGSLADVAKYYYETDLRTSGLSNCTGSLGLDVCQESTTSFTAQQMTTYTLGLGVDGTLAYVSDYDNATSGDYYNLKNGLNSVNWPKPVGDTETAVDDLWHAAVNGRGTYFSAKDPAQLGNSLNSVLAAINAEVGAASAAATSTLNPVADNNYAYVASYTTAKWKGNLEARTINISTGVVSETASWCVESIPQGACASPKTIVADNSGSGVVYNCVQAGSTAAACTAPSVFDTTTNECRTEMTNSCTGTMPSKVAASSDSRTIYKSDAEGVLQPFVAANLNSAYFSPNGLSQWSVLSTDQKAAATTESLVNYLRGQTGYEDRTSNTAINRIYRFREATLGDALESQPFFISKPVFSYADPGYSAYKTAQEDRAGTVYLGANDGMLHAFASDSGVERWAYVPTVVIPNMWKLADKNYATGHVNLVNGSPTISDICTENCTCDNVCVAAGGNAPVWKTILVGGLNAGGRSYYALDITDPATPTLLWEISPSDTGFENLGYSFGQPVITKKSDTDGTWVVLVTSGYNNTSPGNGHGSLFVINAASGEKISEIDTGVGDATTPSGLAKITAWNDYGGINNTAGYVYGGDLLGNLWRFDINAETSSLFATLKDASGDPQPVTTTPTLGLVKGYRVVFVGTGKYLEVTDLTDTSQQTVYAIKDNDGATLENARTALVAQTFTAAVSGDEEIRKGSNNTVDFTTGRGWYIDLGTIAAPDTLPSFVGERVNVDMQLVQGMLIFASLVPSNTVCSPGGYGYLNFVNYETGGYLDSTHIVSTKYNSPIVGINVMYIGGDPVVSVVTSNKPTPEKDDNVPKTGTPGEFTGKRVIWRELIP